ncbi:MAG: hypothetical protein EAZ35_08020 [Sphingobacteriia bacterium]|nr:MAG: hypothetical protein EAZ41_01815 [Sphingobacteriia bacterium]TAG30221.1 MAG: hypothetical protein EAZ35_08020 [Sphingobacteriia bacterium]
MYTMPIKSNFLYLFAALVLLLGSACKTAKRKPQRDITINHETSFNPLFFDSASMTHFFNIHADLQKFQAQYIDFYADRNFEYAWFDSTGLSEQAHNFFNLQNNYINSNEDSSLFSAELSGLYHALDRKPVASILKNPSLLETELMLTGQFFKYAAKVYKGADIDAAELGWFIPRKKIDLSALLDSMMLKKSSSPDQYAPLNPQYKALEQFLTKYIELQKRDNGDTIPMLKKALRLGDSTEIIGIIKQRLKLYETTVTLKDGNIYDSAMLLSVRKYQQLLGIAVDGAVGNKMIAELNTPVRYRVQQLLVNMERMRWMPAANDSNYILVNIPEYRMHVFEGGLPAYDMNVIVGSAANNSVIFNGKLKYIVFSPFWNIPESIVRDEIVPAMRKDPNYIAKHNMEITGKSGGLPLVRQKPGVKNSLGLVKFLFPNNYSIYLHDTPNRNLFSQSSRSLSHGCIRLAEPVKFARYLLREDTAVYSHKIIDSLMHLEKEKWVTLKKSIPVFLVYFTAWVDKKGELNFRKDIYGHDKKMLTKLFNY